MELILYNRVIDADAEDILYKIKAESPHNQYLNRINRKSDYIQIACPFHKDGQETHPSCSVYNRHDNPKVTFGTTHCFSCGYSGSLHKLVSRCLDMSYTDAKYWLIENFSSIYEDRRIILDSFEDKPQVEQKYLDEHILEEYSYFHPYQFQRGLSEDVIRRFKVGWNPNTDSITFPVWDMDNHLVGITERSTKSKRFYIPKDMPKPVYLLNYVRDNNITDVVVCESQINTLTCWTWGLPAIGLIGTGSDEQYKLLRHSGIRNFHLALDGDLAGRHGTLKLLKQLPKDVLCDVIMIPPGKDVNDLTKEEFLALPRVERSEYE